MLVIAARYEEGFLKPDSPLALEPGERGTLILVRNPDPKRWNLTQLAKSGALEDLELAHLGLEEWAEALDCGDAC